MKRFILTTAVLAFSLTAVFAGDDKPIKVNELPATAQQFIKTNFGDQKVAYAKVDREIFDTTYEVCFTNGDKVEFNKNGEWKEIDCEFNRVPSAAVPSQIAQYISTNHAGNYAVEIDRDRYDYEVKLNNGIELKFDLKFNLIGYDR